MNAKDKSMQLVGQFMPFCRIDEKEFDLRRKNAIKCALITVNQIIDCVESLIDFRYWVEVRNELEKYYNE